jgi:hypothetical protein
LKNSFQRISPAKLVRKLLNVRSPQARKFAEIVGLVPFSTPTPGNNNCRSCLLHHAEEKPPQTAGG